MTWHEDVEAVRDFIVFGRPRRPEDALDRLSARLARYEEALRRIQAFQPKRVDKYRWQGIVFDKAPKCDPASWQGVAFWTYTDLCDVEFIARAALADEEAG